MNAVAGSSTYAFVCVYRYRQTVYAFTMWCICRLSSELMDTGVKQVGITADQIQNRSLHQSV
jgi:hypothetical protein